MAVIEMGIPTGFVAELESDITKLTDVQKTETEGQKVIMYFDQVSIIYACFSIAMLNIWHILLMSVDLVGFPF